MKRDNINTFSIIITLFIIVTSMISCNETSDLGLELLPTEDLIDINGMVIKDDISAYNYLIKEARTDETTNSLLGSFNDPVFGKTTIDFAAQYRLRYIPDFGSNPSVDSVKLFLYYSKIYGDTIVKQKFRVYELEEDLDVDDRYTKDLDLKSKASSQLLGEIEYLPAISVDSASSDTLYQIISIPLDNSLGEKLMAADSVTMVNNDLFLEYFKGIFIESEPVSEVGGGILSLESEYSGSFSGSTLVLYFSNDSTIGKDTLFFAPYVISPYSARVNSVKHDYTGTSFASHLDSDNFEDSLIYIQSSGGLKSKIVIDELSSWIDSVNVAINKAELIFQVDTALSQVKLYPPPGQLFLTYIDTAGVEKLPADYNFNTDFYGGALDTTDYTYRFNITQHIQQISKGEISNLGFYLTPGQVVSKANRVVLKGSNSAVGIKLIVTYTKFNL